MRSAKCLTSLQALLAARLDRMGDAKPLLQLGAVLGRQFALTDLQTVAARSGMEVSAMVEKAVGSGLLHEATMGDDSVLIFKHALVQDAAYASLLNSEKRRLHSCGARPPRAERSIGGGGGRSRVGISRGTW